MSKILKSKKYQIISNVKVDIRTEFELVNKALKAVTSFSGEPISGLIIEDNVIFLCWGCSKRDDKDVNFEQITDNDTFKSISKRIQKHIEDNYYLYCSEETTNIPEEDRYDSYSEDCYLGCRISTELKEEKMFYQMKGYFIFAKVIPSWITLEK